MKFVIPDESVKEFYNWKKQHDKTCQSKDAGAIGGRLSFSFTPTGLGDIIKIKCMCGEFIDLTHSERW
jgi:hypothetical protein